MNARLREALTISGAPALAKPPKLTEFERKAGIRLPESYKSFMCEIGSGQLGNYFNFRGFPARKGGGGMSVFELWSLYRENLADYVETYGQKRVVSRLVPFCDTIGGDIIAWDPESPTEAAKQEYQIVMLPDGGSKLIVLAKSFEDLILSVLLTKKFGKLVNDKDYEPDNSYRPA